MSHSITSRRGTTRRRRRASRIGSPPVRRLRAQRPPQVDPAAVAPALVAARAPQRRGELEPRHQPVELRELVRLERVEALAGQPLLVAGQRQRHLDLVAVLVAVAGAGAATPRPLAGALDRASAAPLVGGAGDGPRVVELRRRRPRRVAEDRRRTPRRTPRRAPGRRRTPSARSSTAAGATPAARAPARARTRPARSGVIGTPASCRRRLSAAASGGRSSWIVSTPKLGHRGCTSCSRPAARITSWSSSYLSTEPSVRSTAAASSCSTPSRLSAASQSIASAIPAASARRSRACARPRRRPGRRASPTRP